jgi:hypothetical protein
MDMVFVINKKTEARDWGEISFETVGVWPNFDKAMEHLKDIKEKVGESGTVGIRVNDSHAEWSYSDWDGIYNYEIESVNYYE